MKKIFCLAAALLVINCGFAMAAPLNDLDKGQTAVGASNDGIYIENKLGDRMTFGLQNIDMGRDDMFDFYGQYHFTNHFRGIVGHRDYSGGTAYLGVGATHGIDKNWNGHGYAIFSGEFTELQIGAAYKINRELDANVYYRAIMPDHGDDRDRIGVGLTYKF